MSGSSSPLPPHQWANHPPPNFHHPVPPIAQSQPHQIHLPPPSLLAAYQPTEAHSLSPLEIHRPRSGTMRSDHSSSDCEGSISSTGSSTLLDFPPELLYQSLNSDGSPRRPMNAFMIFARHKRPYIQRESPGMKTGEISKRLSAEWKAMNDMEKQFYLDKAGVLKRDFNIRHPDYVYRRKANARNRRRASSPGDSSPSPTTTPNSGIRRPSSSDSSNESSPSYIQPIIWSPGPASSSNDNMANYPWQAHQQWQANRRAMLQQHTPPYYYQSSHHHEEQPQSPGSFRIRSELSYTGHGEFNSHHPVNGNDEADH